MSLKIDIEECPELWSEEIVSALEDYKNGKRNSKRNLRKFVNREISEHYYNELIERYAALYCINKNKRDEENSQKIKDTFLSWVVVATIIITVLITLGEIVVSYGKAIAFWYIILILWAFGYISSSNSKELSKLEIKNKILEDQIAIYKGINEELKEKLRHMNDNSN